MSREQLSRILRPQLTSPAMNLRPGGTMLRAGPPAWSQEIGMGAPENPTPTWVLICLPWALYPTPDSDGQQTIHFLRITHFKGLMVRLLPTTSHLVLQASPNQDSSWVDSTSLAGTPCLKLVMQPTAALPAPFLPQALRDERATNVTLLLVSLKFLNPHPEPQHSGECG